MGNLYSGGLNILVGYLYSGGLSLLCWAVFILLGCLCSGGPSVFWWAAYNLSLLSCGQSNEIVDYFFSVVCPHFAQHTSKCLFY